MTKFSDCRFSRSVAAVFIIILIAGCAAHFTPEATKEPYGFLSGLWHGAIATIAILANVISWALSLVGVDFLQDIQIIGRPNTGFFYYLGFASGFLWLSIFR